MIIDIHAHYFDPQYHELTDYIGDLLRAMDKCGIEKTCLSAFGPWFRWVIGNEDVAKLVEQYPDRFVGFAFIRPGWDTPNDIARWYDRGMRGIKVTCPKDDYDSHEYDPLWAKSAELDMPVLFHTGIVTMPGASPEEDVSSCRMHPMMLEPIGRRFPELRMICAHLGIHWNEDAAELLRMRPNVWADLTGEPGGFRERLTAERMRELFWWEGAFDRLIFGTDVLPGKVEGNLAHDRKLLDELGFSDKDKERYFYGNAMEVLGLKKGECCGVV